MPHPFAIPGSLCTPLILHSLPVTSSSLTPIAPPQGRMLDELDEDVDTTHSRLKATQKKVLDVIRRSGTNTQLALIAFLVVVLIVLAVFALM